MHFISAEAYHSGTAPYYTREEVAGRFFLTLRLRVRKGLNVTQAFVRTAPEGEEIMTAAVKIPDPGKQYAGEGVEAGSARAIPQHSEDWQWWEARLEVRVPLLGYRFYLVTPDGNYNLNARGLYRSTPLDRDDFKCALFNNPPEWVQDAIFYQIFPERFCCGDPSTNVKDNEFVLAGSVAKAFPWGAPVDRQSGNCSFYGGDLPGISQKIPYLQGLGINALYINPIFTSPSNHKYDVADYLNVDPHFGGNEALVKLREDTKRAGIRIVLDFVPNHCGNQNIWFKKAQADKNSPERGFFTFYNDDNENYETWLGVHTLPRLNYRSQELRDRMYRLPNAVMRHWLKPPYDVDGWRLDVANMLARQNFSQLAHEVGREMRSAIKEEKSQAWLVGEQFFDPTDYQQGDEFDSAMNYRAFCIPLFQWMVGQDFETFRGHASSDHGFLPTFDLAEQMQSFRTAIPETVALNMLNLLGSHDIPRVKTMCGGRVDKVKALHVLMFAYQGAPCIYYGDEIGMEGLGDPDNRRTMIWDDSQWDKSMIELVKKLCAARQEYSALRRGGLQWLYADGNSLAFLREDAHSRAVCAVTRDLERVPSTREIIQPAGGYPEGSAQQSCTGQSGNGDKLASCEFLELDVSGSAIADGSRFKGLLSGLEAVVSNGKLKAVPQEVGAEIWLEQR